MFDSHVHFDAYPDSRGPGSAPARALAAGVRGALNPAIDLASSGRALALHRIHPWIRPCLGLHPQHLGPHREPPVAELRALATQGPFAAVGEVGLDFWGGRGDEPRQRAFLDAQSRLAAELGLPLVLHLRKGFYDGFAVLREAGFQGPVVCHGFTGSRDMARLALDRGGYLVAGAALLRPGAEHLREVFAWAPRDRVLVETDAPPPGTRTVPGRQPWDLPAVVAALAAAWGMAEEAVGELTQLNAEALFPVEPATPAPKS